MEEATKKYDPSIKLGKVESEWIAKSIAYHDGNMVVAAQSLGISRATLYRKFEKIRSVIKSDPIGDPYVQ